MTVRSFSQEIIRKSLAVSTVVVMVLGGAPGLLAQSPAAAIAGVIVDPTGSPAAGFKVTVIDVESKAQFTSGPTDAAGNYSVDVPVGGRYKIDSVIAADGVTKLAVQDVPPVSVLTAGTTRLNVRFTSAEPAAAAAAAPAAAAAAAPAEGTAAATTEEEKKKKKSEVPWYQRPGPATGMILGAAALAALLLIDWSDDDNAASPYNPVPPPPPPADK